MVKLPTVEEPTRLAVCVPARDTVHSLFSYHLVQLMLSCQNLGIPANLFMETGSIISKQRQALASTAVEGNYTHILWLDSDMVFPPETAMILLSHGLPVVACNYSTRSLPLKGVAYSDMYQWNSWKSLISTDNRLVKADAVGMGCMLTATSVYQGMALPWFDVVYKEDMGEFIGEDFFFCQKMRSKGYDVMIDTYLSRQIGHLGTMRFDIPASP